MNAIEQFKSEKVLRINKNANDIDLIKAGHLWLEESMSKDYVYNFEWMGRPIIQHPQDMIAMQELIWEVKPDIIIETGIAHGGSIIYYASILELLGNGKVIGIDIDIREHNRKEIENHPMYKRITLIEGSSIENSTIQKLESNLTKGMKIMVCLDSYHTHDHVLKELELYSKYVSLESYLVVFDSFVEDMPEKFYPNRPWDKGNNPKTAVHEFLQTNDDFVIDLNVQNKLIVTCAPDGYLKKVK